VLEKADLYLGKGSKVVWIVIPTKACVLILTPTGRRWEYENLTCPDLLPDWGLHLKKIFNWPEPKTAA
jgi:Uma2 family endonuclease